MSFAIEEGTFNISFTAFGAVVLAVLVLLLGTFIRKKWGFARKYCIPAPVVGGVLFAVFNLVCHATGLVSINISTAYQNDFQYMFFTIVGFGASFAMLRNGGKKLVLYFIMVGAAIAIQSAIGILGTKITGISPVYGIMCGPAPLCGGHGSVAAYGQMLEDIGYDGAIVVGMAAATFGLIIGSFFGGPIAERLIRKNHLKTPVGVAALDVISECGASSQTIKEKSTSDSIFKHIAMVGLFMVVGGVVGTYLSKGLGFLTGGSITLPGFCGPMLVAFIARNINDKKPFIKVDDEILAGMEDIALGIFLSMAMIGLKLWQLVDLALPMLVILVLETIATLLFIYLVVFRVIGKDYEAAACCSGFCGHAFGATPNGVANLGAVSDRFGYPKLAYLIVPIVGGFLQDIFLVPINVFLINLLA